MRLIFYPHHEMQGYIELFENNSDRVVIARENEFDVQQLLKESKILITDYSSVAFDFAYMKKPVIYYQFDSDKYYESHYAKGYYSYKELGFGPVISDILELKQSLNKKIFKNSNIYESRIKRFFYLNDNCNLKRNYESIKDI